MNLWHWHPSVVLGLGGLVALYVAAVGPLRGRSRWAAPATPETKVGRGRVVAFLGGVAVMAVALLGPLAEWAEHVALSAHMTQHLLLTLVVPPLWLIGTPDWALRPLIVVRGVARVGYTATRPVAAFGLAAATLAVWHVPRFFEAALAQEAIHILEHLTLVGTALLAWWPVAGPLPEWPRLSPPGQLLYLFLATIPMTAVAAPITLADGVLYPFYESAGAAWPLTPRADQELAGVLMWVGGTLGYLAAGTVVFFRWAMQEDAEKGTAVLPGKPSRV